MYWPSTLKLSELGYQPVGMSPLTWLCRGSGFNWTTATSFIQPLVTYNCFSSWERVMLFVSLPRNRDFHRGKSRLGAVTGISASTRFDAVSITATESVLSSAAYRRDCARFSTMRLGCPETWIRDMTLGLAVDTFTTTTSRSRRLEMYAVSFPLIATQRGYSPPGTPRCLASSFPGRRSSSLWADQRPCCSVSKLMESL